MKRISMHPAWSILLIGLLLTPARAGEDDGKAEPVAPGAGEPKAEKPAPPDPFLWKAEGELGTVYLFGTIHIPAPDLLDLPASVRDAINSADIVLTELEITPKVQIEIQKRMTLPPGVTLKSLIPEEDYARIAKKVPLAGFSRTKIWAATQQLMLLHGLKYFSSGRQPMDFTIPAEARAAGKEVGALETPEEQLAVLESMTVEEQIEALEKVADVIAKDKKNGTNVLDELIGYYRKGDLGKMMEFATSYAGEPTESEKKFAKRLIDDRNHVMAKRLLERMEKRKGKTWFVAVGAAHHYGPEGLPAILKAKGFRVKRLGREAD